MIPLNEAEARIHQRVTRRLPAELAPLDEDAPAGALGRRLATSVASDVPWPTTDRSAMDGFALAVDSPGTAIDRPLPVVGESLAGRPLGRPLEPGQAVRITTGAVVPKGANAVVMVEQTSGFHGADGQPAAEVRFQAPIDPGQNIRPVGSELSPGAEVMAPGRLLGAAELGVLAVLGIDPVPTFQRPVVGILSTGDEVVPVDRVPAEHQVRDSNSFALAAQVRSAGGVPVRLGIAPDEPQALRGTLQRALERCDVLLTIGGVSAGTHDLVPGELEALGVVKEFQGIALKPGKPTWFGVFGAGREDERYVIGLPGNPASAFAVFDLLARPALALLQGASPADLLPWGRVPAVGEAFRPNRRAQSIPATLELAGQGEVRARLARFKPSGDPFSLLDGEVHGVVDAGAEPGPEATVTVRFRSGGLVRP